MRTNWKSLAGRNVLIKLVIHGGMRKGYGEVQQVRVLDTSPSRVYVKISLSEDRIFPMTVVASLKARWFHRDDIKLCELLP